MTQANLRIKASLEKMTRLGDVESEALERAGREPTTSSEQFRERNGFDPGFLDGWKIDLPMPAGNVRREVGELRRGGTGAELKYQNFSVIMSKSRWLLSTRTRHRPTPGGNSGYFGKRTDLANS